MSKVKYLIYKVTSDEFSGLCRQFTTKTESMKFARRQRKSGWTGEVYDMRTNTKITK